MFYYSLESWLLKKKNALCLLLYDVYDRFQSVLVENENNPCMYI